MLLYSLQCLVDGDDIVDVDDVVDDDDDVVDDNGDADVVDGDPLNLFPKSWLGCCGGCMPSIQFDAYIIHCTAYFSLHCIYYSLCTAYIALHTLHYIYCSLHCIYCIYYSLHCIYCTGALSILLALQVLLE